MSSRSRRRRSASSDASTRCASIAELDAFVAESAGVVGAEAAEPRANRRAEPRAVPRRAARSRRAAAADARIAAARRPSGLRSPRGTPSGGGQRPRLRHELLDEGGLRTRRLHPGDGARRRRLRGRPARVRGLHSVAFLDIAGYVLGVWPGGHAAGHDRRARGPDRRRCDQSIDVREHDERDEGYIPGSRNIPYRLIASVLSGPPRRPADRDDLQLGAASGHRRQHAAREGLRRAPRRRRGHGGLARPRRDRGQLSPLRELSRS